MIKSKSILLILFSALMFGSYGIWAKLIGTSYGIFYPGWTRSVIIGLVLFPVLYFSKQIIPIKREDWKWMSVFLIFTMFTQAPLQYAFNHMDIGSATLLFFVSMLLTMYAIGFVFFKEKMTKVKLFSFVIAAVGLYITFSFSVTAFVFLASIMAILNGIASGGEISFSKKLSGSYSVLYISWLSWIFIAITNFVISMALGEVQHAVTLDIFWLYQVLYATAGVLGFWAVMEGFKYVEASIGGLLGLLEIVFSIVLGMLIFQQEPSFKVIIGGTLIVLAAALPHISDLMKMKELR